MKRRGFLSSFLTIFAAPKILENIDSAPINGNKQLINDLSRLQSDAAKEFEKKYGSPQFTTWMTLWKGDSETNF